MTETEALLKRPPTDLGGLPAGPIERVEHELESLGRIGATRWRTCSTFIRSSTPKRSGVALRR